MKFLFKLFIILFFYPLNFLCQDSNLVKAENIAKEYENIKETDSTKIFKGLAQGCLSIGFSGYTKGVTLINDYTSYSFRSDQVKSKISLNIPVDPDQRKGENYFDGFFGDRLLVIHSEYQQWELN